MPSGCCNSRTAFAGTAEREKNLTFFYWLDLCVSFLKNIGTNLFSLLFFFKAQTVHNRVLTKLYMDLAMFRQKKGKKKINSQISKILQ
jgi:hypothetical protein